jgi:hypothetical protein
MRQKFNPQMNLFITMPRNQIPKSFGICPRFSTPPPRWLNWHTRTWYSLQDPPPDRMKNTGEHGRGINAPPKSDFRAVAPTLERSHQGAFATVRRLPFDDNSESILCGTCIPMPNGIIFQRCSMEASFSGNFERFTVGRLSFYSGTVKLLRSPGRAGRLTFVLNS